MNNIDPKILELAKRDYEENCELVVSGDSG
jgi:hypothetical protein